MLQPMNQFPQEVQLDNIIKGWVALCPITGAFLSRSYGRTSQAPKYILILPNKSLEERGGYFASYDWDYPKGRKFVRAWSQQEAIEEANKKLEKMLRTK